MKTQTLVRISGMILLVTFIGLVMVALIYALQHPQLFDVLTTVNWNG